MLKRTLVGAGIVITIFLLMWLYGWYIKVGVILAALVTQFEIIRSIKNKGIALPEVILYVYTALLFPAYYFFELPGVFAVMAAGVSALFIAGILNHEKYPQESIINGIFTMFYPQIYFVFLYMIVCMEDQTLSANLLLTMLANAMVTDTFAYFCGTLMGKHKLCPNISPKKTIEGSLAGILGGILGTLLVMYVLGNTGISLSAMPIVILFAAFASVISQFGDLAASLIKRYFGVKDFGNILPGHGGLLDRLDSTLFILPIVYFFFKIYFKF